MKFLCPQCKAKYKIADEKVANRENPRMKCRKCGHLIAIRSAAAPKEEDGRPEAEEHSVRPASAGAGGRAVAMRSSTVGASVPRPAAVPRARTPSPQAPPAEAKASPSPGVGRGAATGAKDWGPAAGFDDDDPTVIKDAAVLSAAFSHMVGASPASAVADRPSVVEDEWYAGIDGAPVGPLSLDGVRAKAREGKLTADTLVWKEGFEDWKPISAFPDLSSILEETRPRQPAPVPPRSLEPAPAAQPAPEPESQLPAQLAGPASVVAPEPPDELAGLPDFRKSRTPIGAWIAVIVAVLFGLTVGIVVFGTKEKEEVVKIIEVPVQGGPSPAETSGEAHEPEKAAEDDETEEQSTAPSPGRARPVGGQRQSGGGEKKKEKSGGLLSGLRGLTGKGPEVGSGTSSTERSSGGELDSAAIQRTVRNYSPSVRRSCWQPALDTRSNNAPSSARVGVTITVAASGRVQSVSTTGDPKGYRGLARCIESRVRGWTFPRSGGTTTVKVPFVFAAQ